MKVSDGIQCMHVTTMCPSFTAFLIKMDMMTEKREIDTIKGAVVSVNLWMPSSRSSIMRKNGKRSWLAFKIEATDFELIDTNPKIMVLDGKYATLLSVFEYTQKPTPNETTDVDN